MQALTVVLLLCCGAFASCSAAEEPETLKVELPKMNFKPVTALPADIPTCSEKDLNLNECMKSAFQQMMPRLRDGVPELNIPPMDPFVLGKSSYQYTSGIVQGRIAMKNVRVYGMSDSIIEQVDFKLKDGHLKMQVNSKMPKILVEGIYKADMKFNDIKMMPKGFFNVSMTDVTMSAKPEGEIYERDGHSYLRLTKFDTVPDVGDMRIYASGLFPDRTLNSIILDFVNQYWRQIYKAMLPETRTTWEPLMLHASNEFLAALPFDFLLTKN